MGFRDEVAFHWALSLATDKAIKEGFFRDARLIDSNLIEYQIQRLELVGKSSLLGWLRRGRDIRVLEVSSGSSTSFDRVKASISDIIERSSFWSENEDVETLIGQIQSARTFPALVDLFG